MASRDATHIAASQRYQILIVSGDRQECLNYDTVKLSYCLALRCLLFNKFQIKYEIHGRAGDKPAGLYRSVPFQPVIEPIDRKSCFPPGPHSFAGRNYSIEDCINRDFFCRVPNGQVPLNLEMTVADFCERRTLKFYCRKFLCVKKVVCFQMAIPHLILCIDALHCNRCGDPRIGEIVFRRANGNVKILECTGHFRDDHVLNIEHDA